MNKRHDEVFELAGIIENKMCNESYLFSDVAAIDAADEILNLGYQKAVWHKVADEDLPKDNKEVLVYTKEGIYIIAFYDPAYDIFNPLAKQDITAWTELPMYEGK